MLTQASHECCLLGRNCSGPWKKGRCGHSRELGPGRKVHKGVREEQNGRISWGHPHDHWEDSIPYPPNSKAPRTRNGYKKEASSAGQRRTEGWKGRPKGGEKVSRPLQHQSEHGLCLLGLSIPEQGSVCGRRHHSTGREPMMCQMDLWWGLCRVSA